VPFLLFSELLLFASGQNMSKSSAEILKIPKNLRDKTKEWPVTRVVLSAGAQGHTATSRMKNFSPPVSLEDALKWILQENATDESTVMFKNFSTISIEKGSYSRFDSFDEDE